ncbi:hypothetical protein CAP35_11230 [Chitinophagaceae bacterium IBVUCB1]|nr:hypothetical protein CAP35_11230 [Chitinophagaceae bacterium IBVUCB1]
MRKINQQILLSAVLVILSTTISIAQKLWQPIGTFGLSDSSVTFTSLKSDKNGVLYLAYGDYGQGLKATVMKYDGTYWIPVGAKGFSTGTVALTTLAIDNNNTPYVAFEEYTWASGYNTKVYKYNGSSWVKLGTYGPKSNHAVFISMLTNSKDTLFIAFKDTWDYKKPAVMKFDGTNWVYVGGPGVSTGDGEYISLDIDKNDSLFIAYSDVVNGSKVTVKKLIGSNWTTLGKVGFSVDAAEYVCLKVDKNSTPFVAYSDLSIGRKATVMKYDGTKWVTVGKQGFSNGSARHVSLAIDSTGSPVVAFQDQSDNNKVTVMKFDGSKWVSVGNIAFSDGGIEFTSLIIDKSGSPCVAYRDYANSSKATVMKFNCPYPQSKVDICAVFTDSASGFNTILWDGSNAPYVDSYTIYRENSGNYDVIGKVPHNVNKFIDITASATTKKYKYRITLIDSCFRETNVDSSKVYNTIHLKFNYLFNNQASISWNTYEGIPNLTYVVMRSNNGGVFSPIANLNISGSDTTFIDNSLPSGSNRYRIEALLPNPCTNVGTSYDRTISNVITAWNTSISEVHDTNEIKIHPNPVGIDLKIMSNQLINKIEVFDLTGKRIVFLKEYHTKEAIINVSELSPGTYFLKVNDTQHAYFTKQ